MPTLILIKSPGNVGANQKYPLGNGSYTVGRDDSCDFVLPNQAVSKKHAQISHRPGGQYYVEDLKSRNGTTVNNEPVLEARRLVHEDRVKICDFLFRYHDENAKDLIPLPQGLGRASSVIEPDALDEGLSTIENSLSVGSADKLLESQPGERLRAIYEISLALSKSPDLESLFGEIADQMLKVFRQADRCFVILQDEEKRLVPKVVKARRSAGSEDDQRFSKTIVKKAISTAEAYLSEDASSDSALGAAMSIAEFRIRSVMCVPLASGSAPPFGAIQLDTQDRTKKFRQGDLELLAIVANLAAVAVERGRMQEAVMARDKQQNELNIAVAVQKGFLPQKLPHLPGYEFFHHYSAAQSVGGDYYDFIPLHDGRVAIVLGDVAGKGVPAALLMAKLSAEVRFCLFTQTDAAMAIRLLNEELINGGIGDRFVTLALLIIDPVSHRVVVVNAGHINPIVYMNGTSRETISDADSGIPLGIMSGYEYISAEVTLTEGENLLVFSDGVTDAMDPAGVMFNDVRFDRDGVKFVLTNEPEKMNRPTTIGERFVKAVKNHASGTPQNDDIAFVCVGRLLTNLGKSPSDTGSMHVPTR
ncbi:SpoIIE family protein phosphatase [soil metagenome]